MNTPVMVNLENKYKDSSPFETIRRIKDILNGLDIHVYEKSWHDNRSKCYSVRVEVDGFPDVGTNGKGATRLFALASAYGELMERLQNKKLFNKTYGLKYLEKSYSDEITGDIGQFAQQNPDMLEDLVRDFRTERFKNLIREYTRLSSFVEFRNVFTGNQEYLPSQLIKLACGTNGMCAGNTAHEAICHGICELMERYITKKILEDQEELPDIPLTEVVSEQCLSIIRLLEGQGFKIRVKDCTLGGKYPVVGVLVTNRDGTKYQLRLGSESVFSIALERCLTEILQGEDVQSFQNSLLPIVLNPIKDPLSLRQNLDGITKNGSGHYPNTIFCRTQDANTYKKAFLPDLTDNKESYEQLCSILQENSFDLYIRDLSFLGFPTYMIYIPGMSEVFLLDSERIEEVVNVGKVAKTLLNIWDADRDELQLLAGEIDKCLAREERFDYRVSKSVFFKSMNLYLLPHSFQEMDLRMVNALVHYILSNYERSSACFSSFLLSVPNKESYLNWAYYKCIEAFLQCKSDGLEDESCRELLDKVFAADTVQEVLTDFSSRTTVLLKHMPLPSCPDCGSCKLNDVCMREQWLEVNYRINAALAGVKSFAPELAGQKVYSESVLISG